MRSKMKNYKRTGNIISGIGALIAIISIIFFFFNWKRIDREIALLNENNLKLSELVQIDSLNNVKIKALLTEYAETINNHNLNNFKNYFADTISRFFLLENISSQDAYYQMRWYWNTYPSARNEFDFSSMTIEKHDDGFIIFIPSNNKKNATDSVDILSEIRLDKDLKIYYIRDFFASKEESK